MPRRRTLFAAILICLTAGAAAAEVPHVANPATPRHGVADVRLQEVWRVGGEDDDANLFGVVAQIIADEKGNLYVLDGQLSEVAVFAPDGRRTGTLGREGEGPGEFRRPADAFFLPDGKLAVVQVFPARSCSSTAREPRGRLPLPGRRPRGRRLRGAGRRQQPRRHHGAVRHPSDLRRGQAEPDLLPGRRAPRRLDAGHDRRQDRRAGLRQHGPGRAGRGLRLDALGPRAQRRGLRGPHRDRYLVERHAADGKLLGTFERPYTPLARDRADHDRAESLLKAQARNYPVPPPVKVADSEPHIQSLTVLDDGSVWILSGRGQRGQPDGVMLTYDVFDAKGAFDRQVRVHADADGLKDQLFLISPDRAVLVLNFWDAFLAGMGAGEETDAAADVAPMEIISCRIVR
ncbi:MAG: hypothetical protein IPM94_00010 [bacterium]|nr:hypothetical protein [bacterium]